MWKNLMPLTRCINQCLFLTPEKIVADQIRTTFILRRIRPLAHGKLYGKPQKLKSRHYEYELVQDTTTLKKPEIDVILTAYVDGIGDIGDKVRINPNKAYNKLLLPGLAVYCTPEDEKRYLAVKSDKKVTHSSPFALRTVNVLERASISIVMNKTEPWTIKPWHVRTSLRKVGYHVPESAITMPSKPIKGPDMDLEAKEFYVTVTINNMETANVRCKIHHWSTDITERLPWVDGFWKLDAEPVFPEDEDVLKDLREKSRTRVDFSKK